MHGDEDQIVPINADLVAFINEQKGLNLAPWKTKKKKMTSRTTYYYILYVDIVDSEKLARLKSSDIQRTRSIGYFVKSYTLRLLMTLQKSGILPTRHQLETVQYSVLEIQLIRLYYLLCFILRPMVIMKTCLMI